MSNQEIINKLHDLLFRVDKFKNCYFWSSDNGNAKQRESYCHYWNIPTFSFYESGNLYTVKFTVEQSRHNTYVKTLYTRNNKKTTLTAIKNALKRLETVNDEK